MFPLALSLGICSRCEVMDIDITEDMAPEEIVARMNRVLPEGMKILHAAEPALKHTEIAFAQYNLRLAASCPPGELLECFRRFIERETIEIEKVSKKKIPIRMDIKPQIDVLDMQTEPDALQITVRLPAGTQENLNVNLVCDAFEKDLQMELENIWIERTKILTQDGKDFL